MHLYRLRLPVSALLLPCPLASPALAPASPPAAPAAIEFAPSMPTFTDLALAERITPVKRTIVTTNVAPDRTLFPSCTNGGYERRVTPRKIDRGGTFGDSARPMQLLTGDISDTNERNDLMVRGDDPTETSLLIENMQMPSTMPLLVGQLPTGR